MDGGSPCGRRCLGPSPGVREPISFREAHLRRVHQSLERLRGQTHRALPQLQSAQVSHIFKTPYFFRDENCMKTSGNACLSSVGIETCGVALWQVPQGYPAWACESRSGGGVEEAHCARAAVQAPGEDHQGCRGEPQEQRLHFVAVGYCNVLLDLAKLLVWFR